MKLGIMQPYFFPYIGYWQLLNAVDTYVVYDDVTFIKGGWIHRNRIQINGQAQFINVQMEGASSFRRICDIGVNPDLRWRKKLLQTLSMAYHRSPHYKETFPLVERYHHMYRKTSRLLSLLFLRSHSKTSIYRNKTHSLI